MKKQPVNNPITNRQTDRFTYFQLTDRPHDREIRWLTDRQTGSLHAAKLFDWPNIGVWRQKSPFPRTRMWAYKAKTNNLLGLRVTQIWLGVSVLWIRLVVQLSSQRLGQWYSKLSSANISWNKQTNKQINNKNPDQMLKFTRKHKVCSANKLRWEAQKITNCTYCTMLRGYKV